MTVRACGGQLVATMSRPALIGRRAKEKVEVGHCAPAVSYLTFIIIFGNDSVDVQRTNAGESRNE